MDTIAIIPCTNQKANIAGPAREVWVGNHFQLSLAHCELWYGRTLVMSYKYGLIAPEAHIEPYDINIAYASAGDRLKWWIMLRKQIQNLAEEKPDLVSLYTGNFERDRIMREFVKAGTRNVIVPWEGATVGQRMQLIYDNEPPFDEEKIRNGEYALPENYGEPRKRGRKPKVVEPVVKQDEDIEWE